jgi:hypothetical protein
VTEDAWVVCTDPQRMLKFLRGKASDRKLRLFACGCCRRVWDALTLTPVRRAVEAAEHYADGSVRDGELNQAHKRAISAYVRTLHRTVARMESDAAYATRMYRMALAVNTAHPAPFEVGQLDRLGKDKFLKAFSPDLVRCVVGNPFRPASPDPRWLTPTVVHLARAIYDERAFDRLPILADALEEAGCDNTDILRHCRGPGPHVRGCWPVDLVLEKS